MRWADQADGRVEREPRVTMSSKRRSRSHSTTAWLAVALQLWLGLAAASGLVLCLAADGHIALERAHPGEGCLSELSRHHGEGGLPAALHAISNHDHACQDFPAVRAEARDRVADGQLALLASLGAESVLDLTRGERHLGRLASVVPVHAPPVMRHLRVTVILV